MSVDIKIAADMIYLLHCAVNRISPDKERLNDIDLDGLYALSEQHMLRAAVAYGLESAGISDERFIEAKAAAMRLAVLFDVEAQKVYSMLNEKGIEYLPLKGAVLKSLYPSFGMREMSDIDILCSPGCAESVRDGMTSLGYECLLYDSDYEDVYRKTPVTLEMHSRLFYRKDMDRFSDYYADVWDKLIRSGGEFGYRFTPEDMYLYLLAHEYKHYKNGGTGLRSLLDIYVLLKEYGEALDRDRLSAELEKLELVNFEKINRELSFELFSKGELSDSNIEQLGYFLESGTYGNAANIKYNKTNRALGGKDSAGAKIKYMLGIVFIHGDMLKRNYPFFSRHKILLPALYIFRIFRAIFIQPFKTISDLRYIKRYKKIVDTDTK